MKSPLTAGLVICNQLPDGSIEIVVLVVEVPEVDLLEQVGGTLELVNGFTSGKVN